MKSQQNLIDSLERAERLVNKGKLHRVLSAPLKYLRFKSLHVFKQSRLGTNHLFFGVPFKVLLPSGVDIYLFGIKTHNSETRLAKYLIRNLTTNQTFLDVGAHYGYFSVLASKLVESSGQVIAFEPSKQTHLVLKINVADHLNVSIHNVAVGEKNQTISFRELPIYYSEYNSIYHDQYEDSDWYAKQELETYSLPLICLDDFVSHKNLKVDMIKMDVEGAEHDVIKGMTQILTDQSPIVIMEYSFNHTNNKAHQEAVRELIGLEFVLYQIQSDGRLEKFEMERLFRINLDDSDNIVFKKETL